MLFWAEDATRPPPTRYRKAQGTRPHPFCADAEAQRDLFRSLEIPPPKTQGTAALWLPSGRWGPLPSPGLQHEWSLEDAKPPALMRWELAGFSATPLQAFTVLNRLPGADQLPSGLRLGADARYWQAALMLLLETLAQQKLLPLLAQADAAGTTFHARWLPVLDGEDDGPRLAQLRAAMPPLCRAGAPSPPRPCPRALCSTAFSTPSRTCWRATGAALRLRAFPAAGANLLIAG